MEQQQLKKSLNLPQVITLAAGGMIAAWMVEIKYWFELTGTGSFLALIVCAIFVLPLCFIYAEMTTTMPYAGGENIWITNAFGWNAGWLCVWFVLLLYVMAMPTVSFGIAGMVSYLYPVTDVQVKIIAAAILVVWFFLTNYELKFIAKLQSILFWTTLAVSLAASLIFIFSGAWSFENFKSNLMPNGFSGFSAAIALLIMKFIGFDMIPQLSEETTFPKKDMWKAFVGSLGFTVIIYAMAVIGVGGIVSQEWVLQTDIVDPRVADIIDMHWLGVAIVIMGTGTCLTTLSGFWISASRTFFGAAKQGQFTKKLTKLNKHGQPVLANFIVGILSIYFTVFAPSAWVDYIYTIYSVNAGVVYLMVSLAFLRLRQKHPEWERPYKLKAPWFFGTVGVVFCIYVIYVALSAMNMNAWIVLLIYLALGVMFWAYAKIMQKKNPEEWKVIITSPDTEMQAK
ncbi:MAG: APC family permease [Eubacteriales Family XIII. Incertae Sedis bacterium]|nr:MAG: APC family permease [Clostridiales Family XIII bacterium]